MNNKDQILNIILGIICIGLITILTINGMGRLVERRQSTDTLYIGLPPAGESTLLEDYQTAMETLRKTNPKAATQLEGIMDSINQAK